MKSFILLLSAFAMCACSVNQVRSSEPRIRDYQVEKNEYAIIVILDEGVSYKEARKKALEKAAQLTLDNGYRYFSIVSEKNIQIIPGKTDWPSPYDFPQNLYREEIEQRGYDRERKIQEMQSRDYEIHPAIKMKIKASKIKTSPKDLDAKDYVK